MYSVRQANKLSTIIIFCAVTCSNKCVAPLCIAIDSHANMIEAAKASFPKFLDMMSQVAKATFTRDQN